MNKLNINWVRKSFPALKSDWIYFDNAGGSQTAAQVGTKIIDYLYTTNVQLGASYEISEKSTARVNNAQKLWSKVINASLPSEVIIGSSTTALLQNLSRSMVQQFKAGDEVIITNCDHEANIGPWIKMQDYGIIVKVWKVNPDTYRLELDELAKLMSPKTKLVAFTHASNVLGTINDVKKISDFVHKNGAMVCVDGVAYAPHRHIDVKELDVDFYVFSLYKVYGPHISLLYAKHKHLTDLPGINHFFIGNNDIPYKLQPGNVNYELTYGSTGIVEYFESVFNEHFKNDNIELFERIKMVFQLFANQEQLLSQPLIDYLKNKKGIQIIGESSADKNIRVPTISFTAKGFKSNEIPLLVDKYKIGIRWGDFYARRLITDIGLLENEGIVRISMVHYNTLQEVEKLIDVLDKVLDN